MTREEAIKRLEEGAPFSALYNEQWEEALNMAIEALKGHDTVYKREWVLAEMGDMNLYECPLCRSRKTYMTPFCDICGAKMS
jgi:hypothetical protein